MPPESPRLPPVELAPRVRLLKLPLRCEAVDRLRRRLTGAKSASGSLALAHALGDVRFAPAFAPAQRGSEAVERWHGALAAFGLVEGPAPALIAYTVRPLAELAAVPLPVGWPDDPIAWEASEEVALLPRLERRAGTAVPFATEVWPKVRVVDPAKAPVGNRRVPRTREMDAARQEQLSRLELSRAEAYGLWLQRQLPAAEIDPTTIRIMGETTAPAGDGRSFAVLGLRLNGMLRFTDPTAVALALLRGVGRRRAYGLGLLVVA